MPTSSQALILRNTDGPLQPAFGRPHWRPKQSWMDLFTGDEISNSTFLFNKHPRRKSGPLKKAEIGHQLHLDFSALQDLLKIHGLRGSFIYDVNSNALKWKIPAVNNINFRSLGTDWSVRKADHNTYSRSWPDTVLNKETLAVLPRLRRTGQVSETANFRLGQVINNKKILNKSHDLVSLEHSDGQMEMVKAPLEEALYFRLMRDPHDACFRLVKCDPGETGSFRLESTNPADIGDYHLIPPDGHGYDDLRLVTLDAQTGRYHLLKADPTNNRQYRTVTSSGVTGGRFRLTQAVHGEMDTYPVQNNNQPALVHDSLRRKPENIGRSAAVETGNSAFKPSNSTNSNKYTAGNISEDQYNYFNDVISQMEMENDTKATPFLPDITLYDSKNLTTMHPDKHLTESENSCKRRHSSLIIRDDETSIGKDKVTGNDTSKDWNHRLAQSEDANEAKRLGLMNSQNEMDAFRERFIDSYRDVSPEMYDRLVQLKFKQGTADVGSRSTAGAKTEYRAIESILVKHGSANKRPGAVKKYRGTDWRLHTFEPWSRLSNTSIENDDAYISLTRNSITNEAMKMPKENRKPSLIDEVKLKANYKAWKKKKITAVRMRKDLPPKDKNAVCISLRDNAISHEHLKMMIEKSTGNSLISLQFDPISVHSIDADAKSQWILRFDSKDTCDRLVESGLSIEGELLPVRRYDDVMKEEHDAYQYYCIMNEMKQRKREKMMENDNKSKANQRRKFTSSHTQTAVS